MKLKENYKENFNKLFRENLTKLMDLSDNIIYIDDSKNIFPH